MAGLLDFTNTDEGMQGLGLLSAAAPSMAPMNLAGRIAMAGQSYQGMKTDVMKRQMLEQQMQMEQVKTLMAQRSLGMKLDAYYGDGSGGVGAGMGGGMGSLLGSPQGAQGGNPLASGSSPSMPGSPAVGASGGSGMPYDLARIQKFALSGMEGSKELFDIYKYQHEPKTYAPGSVNEDRMTGKVTTIPSMSADGKASQLVPDASVPGGFRVIAPAGAVDAFGAFNDRAKDNDIVTVPDGSGGSVQMLGKDARARFGGQPQGAVPSVGSGWIGAEPKGSFAGDPQQIRDTLLRIPDPQTRSEALRALSNQMGGRNPDFSGQGSPMAQPSQAASGKFGYTPPVSQLEADKVSAVADVKLRTDPALKSATDIAGGDATNFTGYKNTLNKSVETGYQQYMRNQTIEQLMQSYKTGLPNPEARSAFASGLKNMFPDNQGIKSFAESVNGGNIGSGQMLANLLSSAGLTNVIRTLDGNGRINKAEFQALQEHAEQNRSDPDALLGIMRYQNNAFKQDYAEQQALATKEKEGPVNPKTWQADYLKTRMDNLSSPGALPLTPAQQSGRPPASALSDSLPTANKSNMGKMAIDHDTGKKYRSNGLQWQEVK